MPAHTLQVCITSRDGQSHHATVPASIVHDLVTMGSYSIPGIVIQPEDMISAFPDFKPSAIEWLGKCIEYGINEGDAYEETRIEWDMNEEDSFTVWHRLSPFTVETLQELEGQAIADADGESA